MISYQRLSELSLNWILTGPELFWKYFCPKIVPKYLPNRESRPLGDSLLITRNCTFIYGLADSIKVALYQYSVGLADSNKKYKS
jgi:hypothetical protein